MSRSRFVSLLALSLLVSLGAAGCANIEPLSFDPPARTGWRPDGCRGVHPEEVGARHYWRSLHSDATNSDEVESALAPAFEAGWISQSTVYDTTGPTFDAAGNLYLTPLLARDGRTLVSLDSETGNPRWAISGEGSAGGAPLILDDPATPGAEQVFVGLYDRVLAYDTDGRELWRGDTGLTLSGGLSDTAYGLHHLPGVDALLGLTLDGRVYAVDRTDGQTLLSPPHELPGSPSPAGAGLAISDDALARVEQELSAFMQFPSGVGVDELIDVLLGNEVEVANYFAVDARRDRLWVAATAPDGADGSEDGVSRLGSIYRLDATRDGDTLQLTEGCRADFEGGSASSPALSADGSLVYVGDNDGSLIALDADCQEFWSIEIGGQLVGSVGVSSDNAELYVATTSEVVRVTDRGSSARVDWRADLTAYAVGANQANFNLMIYGIAANGVAVQIGAGLSADGTPLPYRVGLGLLDRETGDLRWFADGLEESVGVVAIGPDGAVYTGSSPLRRAFARVLFPLATAPLEGGIRKFSPVRYDLFARDAVCAAHDRLENALEQDAAGLCAASVEADRAQVAHLIGQAEGALEDARGTGELDSQRADAIGAELRAAEAALAGSDDAGALVALEQGCGLAE